jgi:hypothetical protein
MQNNDAKNNDAEYRIAGRSVTSKGGHVSQNKSHQFLPPTEKEEIVSDLLEAQETATEQKQRLEDPKTQEAMCEQLQEEIQKNGVRDPAAVEAAEESFKEHMKNAGHHLGEFCSSIGKATRIAIEQDIPQAARQTFGAAARQTVAAANAVEDKVKRFFKAVWDGIKKLAEAIAKVILQGARLVGRVLAEFFKGILEAIFN